MSYDTHRQSAQSIRATCGVLTLSDTRTEETDTSGQAISRLLAEAGHRTGDYRILPDEPTLLSTVLQTLIDDETIDVILTNGGTGVSRRDQTIPVIERMIETPIPGFGELFRMLSWEQIKSGAMISRCVGGMVSGKLIFAMPGSTSAVELAMTKLILPELRHLLFELRK